MNCCGGSNSVLKMEERKKRGQTRDGYILAMVEVKKPHTLPSYIDKLNSPQPSCGPTYPPYIIRASKLP